MTRARKDLYRLKLGALHLVMPWSNIIEILADFEDFQAVHYNYFNDSYSDSDKAYYKAPLTIEVEKFDGVLYENEADAKEAMESNVVPIEPEKAS
tara:strand:- start:522 stop:806 length:285 start_codon:yes stop_codon:yes gene_type:complete